MRIERTPVTVYDVFGYVLPGVLIVTYILYDVGIFDDVKGKILNTPDIWADDALIAILYFTFCYVMGQVLSYLGTFFIEDVVRAFYGAPGCYLMMEKEEQEEKVCKRIWKKINTAYLDEKKGCFYKLVSTALWGLRALISFFHGLILRLLKPLISPYLYASDRFGYNGDDFPPGPRKHLKKFVNKRIRFEIEFNEKNNGFLFLLAASLILYEEESKYINNYLVLTGAMRTFSMAFLVMAWWEVGESLFYKFGWISCYYATLHFNSYYALLYGVTSLILMLLYMKFDRRYAEEIITAVIHNNYEEKKSEEKKCPIYICEKKK